MYSNRQIRVVFAIPVLVLVSACSHAIPLSPNVATSSATSSVDEDVGVYFSEEFRTYEHSGSRFGDTWVFPLGPASVEIFGQTFDQVFKRTETVPLLPPLGAEHAGLAAVIETRIEEFDFHVPFLKTQTYTAQITYRFVLHKENGEPVASWTVTGDGAKPGQIGFEYSKWPGQAADAAMEDAAKKFSEGILHVPEVRRWLRERGIQTSRVDPIPAQKKDAYL